jgi:hypothetical protein
MKPMSKLTKLKYDAIEFKWMIDEKVNIVYEHILFWLARFRIISWKYYAREFFKDDKHLACSSFPNCDMFEYGCNRIHPNYNDDDIPGHRG